MMTMGWVRIISITASPPNLPEMVGADDCVIVAAPNIVYARFELNDIVNVRPIVNGPIHATTNPT